MTSDRSSSVMIEEDGAVGTVTALETQTHNTDRVSVFVDGDFAFGVHEDLVVKHQLRVGCSLTQEEQRDIEWEDQYRRARQRALDYLAHKPRTEHEVRRTLRKRDVPSSIIDDVIDRLYELTYLDDEQYAENYVRNRFSNKKYGPIRLRRELVQRGIDRALAEAAVEELFSEKNMHTVAREHAEKRSARLTDADPRRRKQKLYRYLRRRGFRTETIYGVLNDLEWEGRE